MEPIDLFDDIINNKTRDHFHDSIMKSFRVETISKSIIFEIEHMRDSKRRNVEDIILSTIGFVGISKLKIDNNVEAFPIENDIDNIEVEKNDNVYVVKLSGIMGWNIEFEFEELKYNEKRIGNYRNR